MNTYCDTSLFDKLYSTVITWVESNSYAKLAVKASGSIDFDERTNSLIVYSGSNKSDENIVGWFYADKLNGTRTKELGSFRVLDGFSAYVKDVFRNLLMSFREVECFDIKPAEVEGGVDRRFIRREWIKAYTDHGHRDLVDAFAYAARKLVEHLYGAADCGSKAIEMVKRSDLAGEGDVEVYIYHITRTRV